MGYRIRYMNALCVINIRILDTYTYIRLRIPEASFPITSISFLIIKYPLLHAESLEHRIFRIRSRIDEA